MESDLLWSMAIPAPFGSVPLRSAAFLCGDRRSLGLSPGTHVDGADRQAVSSHLQDGARLAAHVERPAPNSSASARQRGWMSEAGRVDQITGAAEMLGPVRFAGRESANVRGFPFSKRVPLYSLAAAPLRREVF